MKFYILHRNFYSLLIVLFAALGINAQNGLPLGKVIPTGSSYDSSNFVGFNKNDKCGFIQQRELMKQKYPQRFQSTEDFEKWLAPKVKAYKNQLSQRSSGAIFTIPVIVHIIHDGQPIGTGDNISHARVKSQIAVLNEDFRNLNKRKSTIPAVWLPTTGDSEIEFCLASTDENGQPLAEEGVNRVTYASIGANPSTSVHSLNYVDASIKPPTQWDPTRYMNVWVVSMAGGVLGYAQFPEGSGLSGIPGGAPVASTDGVVAVPGTFGGPGTLQPYHLGQTMTHEVGHWLGLRHVWGDGPCSQDDFCADTPEMSAMDFGCPTFPSFSNACGSPPNGTMFFNYMNYCDDQCLTAFSNDQNVRMKTVLQNSPRRKELANSTVCAPPVANDLAISNLQLPLDSLCTTSINAQVEIKNIGTDVVTSVDINYDIDGANAGVYNWTGNLTQGQSETIALPTLNVTTGNHNYNVSIDPNSLNGGAPIIDLNANNNTWQQAFFNVDGEFLTVHIDLDCFGNEVDWQLEETTSGLILAQGAGYRSDTVSVPINHKVCVPKNTCLEFTIDDSYGNGLNGSSIPFLCSIDGDYHIEDANGNRLVNMGIDPDYGYQNVHQFCLPFTPTLTADFTGCNSIFTDRNAIFTNTSTADPNITSYFWDFGPNAIPSTSTDENPAVTYTASGSYDVKLVVSNVALKDSVTKTACVVVTDPPPGFCDTLRNYDLYNGDELIEYSIFRNWGYFPGHNGMLLKSYVEPFPVDNDTVKVRDIVLHATRVHAATPTSTVKFVIYDQLNGLPNNKIYSYDYLLSNILANTANQIYLPGTPLSVDTFYIGFELSYDLGDTLVVQTAASRIGGDNTTLVQLQNLTWVTASQALAINTAMGIDLIFSDHPALGIYTMSDSLLCNGGTVDLDASASDAFDDFGWVLTGGSPASSSATALTVSYATPGLYEVKLHVDNLCSIDTIVKTVLVSDGAPTADFNLLPAVVCELEQITFDASTSTKSSEFEWSIQGGLPDTSSQMIDSSRFTSNGQYTISLTVRNGCGTDTYSEQVNVGDAPTTIASNDTIVCEGESITLTASGGTDIVWSTGAMTPSINFTPLYDTVIWVTASNASCPGDTLPITVLINPLPIIVANAHKTLVQPGENVNFSEFGSNAVTYDWDFGDGDTLTGAVGSNDYDNEGTYYAVLRGKFGNCYGYDTVVIVVDRTASIDDINDNTLVEIFPNPTTGLIHIKSENFLGDNLNINFMDQSGKLVHSENMNVTGNVTSFDVSFLAKGVYHLNIHGESFNSWVKVVVQN